jgi:cytochrome P450
MNTIPSFKATFIGAFTPLVFANDPLGFIRRGFDTCGDTFKMKLFREFIITREPAYFKHVLQQNNKNYTKGQSVDELSKVLGNGLLTSEGDFWLRQRRLIQPAFHRERLQGLFKTMGDITRNFLEELEADRNKEAIFIDEKMMAITADIALKTLFSSITNESKAKVYGQINRTQDHLITRIRRPYLRPFLGLSGATKRFKADLTYFDKLVYDIIAQRRVSGQTHDDMLQLLLDSLDEETGEQMNNQQIRDEAITMFAAGHETSANGLNWLLLELSKQPEMVAKIRAESMIFEDVPSFEQLMQLTYTRQVVEEGLRLFSPAWAMAREAVEDDEIEGCEIKKGTTIFMPIFELHRNPKIWKNPTTFDPENFNLENTKNRNKFDYLPFGAGPRFCIGQQFALMEMQLVLASVLKRFTFEADPAFQVRMFPLITLKPKNGIKMFVR